MSEQVSRPGAIIGEADMTRVISELAHRPETSVGTWTVTASRWELRSQPVHEGHERLLAVVEVAHGTPHPHVATITTVTVTEAGQALGLPAETVCNMALATAALSLDSCERTEFTAPPVFSGRRMTDRTQWQASAAARSVSTVSADVMPGTQSISPERRHTPDDHPRLDPDEDRELRRLHYLATFGGLTAGPALRYAELRQRDRRSAIREPHDDDLVVLPLPRSASIRLESASW